MFIIFGFGKKTRKVVGGVGTKTCNFCNTQSVWQLCIIRTWFTLFFIPVIPYEKYYCISCPNCKSYLKLTKEDFEQIERRLLPGNSNESLSDAIKYRGKTEAQINYLKQMEEIEKSKQPQQ